MFDESDPQGLKIYIDGVEDTEVFTYSGSGAVDMSLAGTLQAMEILTAGSSSGSLDELTFINMLVNSSDVATLASTEYYPVPNLIEFTSNVTTVYEGETIEFCWNTTGVRQDFPNPLEVSRVGFTDWNVAGDVNCSIITPDASGTYRLTGYNENGSALSTYSTTISDITITVINPCDGISTVSADKTMTSNCEVSTVTYSGNYNLDCDGYTLNVTTSGDAFDLGGNSPYLSNCIVSMPNAAN